MGILEACYQSETKVEPKVQTGLKFQNVDVGFVPDSKGISQASLGVNFSF